MNDADTTLSQLKDSVSKFCEERNWTQFHNPKDLAIGVATEAGELWTCSDSKPKNKSRR